MVRLVMINIDKANGIPHINVIPPTFEGDDGDNLWRVWNQQHPNVTYKIHSPFIEYANCICEWALWAIFASIWLLFYWLVPTLHWRISLSIVAPILGLIMVVWNPYSSTQYIYNWMMVRMTMRIANKIGLMRLALLTLVGGLVTIDEDGHYDNVNVPEHLSTPMDWVLTCLHETLANITNECGEGASIELCDHATLFVWGVASNIRTTIWPKSTNPCTQEWYFIKWMVDLKTPSTKWKIGMKQQWNIWIPIKRKLGNKERLYTCTHIWI